jgi:hypothetical protein
MELITVKQLPVLEEKFKEVGKTIDEKVTRCESMLVTEDNFRDVKKIRAELNKESKAYADEFKHIKTTVLGPWLAVEDAYKTNIVAKYQDADTSLKSKITAIENGLKEEKEKKVVAYFEEYRQSCSIDFITWEDAGITVNMSTSLKALKEKAKAFVDGIVSDLNLIDVQQDKAEIMVEYKKDLNVSRAITTVSERREAIEKQKRLEEEEAARKAEEQERLEAVQQYMEPAEEEDYLAAPVEEQPEEAPGVGATKPVEVEEQFIAFKVYGDKEKLIALVKHLKSNNYKYEQIQV